MRPASDPRARRRTRQIGPAIDRSTIDRARTGDRDAFDQIVRARKDAVFRLSFAILGNEADARDASQEAFVAMWRGMRQLRDPDRIDAWLQRTVVNAARQLMRARRRRRAREIAASDVVDLGRAPVLTLRDDAAALDAALSTLTPEQRSILVLHHLEHRGVAELSEILGIPTGTAKSRLFAARRALAAAIAPEDAP